MTISTQLQQLLRTLLPDKGFKTAGSHRDAIIAGVEESKTYTDEKAAEAVKKTGNETIAGVKTFSDGIVGNVTGNASTVTNGVYNTGNQTIGGVKTFTSSPILPDATAAQHPMTLNQGVVKTQIKQTTGTSETDLMSQRAVTDEFEFIKKTIPDMSFINLLDPDSVVINKKPLIAEHNNDIYTSLEDANNYRTSAVMRCVPGQKYIFNNYGYVYNIYYSGYDGVVINQVYVGQGQEWVVPDGAYLFRYVFTVPVASDETWKNKVMLGIGVMPERYIPFNYNRTLTINSIFQPKNRFEFAKGSLINKAITATSDVGGFTYTAFSTFLPKFQAIGVVVLKFVNASAQIAKTRLTISSIDISTSFEVGVWMWFDKATISKINGDLTIYLGSTDTLFDGNSYSFTKQGVNGISEGWNLINSPVSLLTANSITTTTLAAITKVGIKIPFSANSVELNYRIDSIAYGDRGIKPVVLFNFDGVDLATSNAFFPILKANGIPFTVFNSIDFQYMSIEEMHKIKAYGGELQVYGRLPVLFNETGVTYQQKFDRINTILNAVKDNQLKPPTTLALTQGAWDSSTMTILQNMGIKVARSTVASKIKWFDNDTFYLPCYGFGETSFAGWGVNMVNSAIATKDCIAILTHGLLVEGRDPVYYVSQAVFEQYVAFLKAKIDAGEIVCMTFEQFRQAALLPEIKHVGELASCYEADGQIHHYLSGDSGWTEVKQ